MQTSRWCQAPTIMGFFPSPSTIPTARMPAANSEDWRASMSCLHRESYLEDNKSLTQWVHDEKPITHPAQDLFDHRFIAQRIAGVLRNESISTVGLLGSFGSGKSGILNLVEFYLCAEKDGSGIHNRRRFLPRHLLRNDFYICRVEAWGRERAGFAQQILRSAVSKIGEQIDSIGLRSLPNEYGAALSTSGTSWGALLSALGS